MEENREVATASTSLSPVTINTGAVSPEPETSPPASPLATTPMFGSIYCEDGPAGITLEQQPSTSAALIIASASAPVAALAGVARIGSRVASDVIAAAAAAKLSSQQLISSPPATSALVTANETEASARTKAVSQELSAAPQKKKFFRDVAKKCVSAEGEYYFCSIEPTSNCKYKQNQARYDAGNFIRHLRVEHSQLAKEKGLFKNDDTDVPQAKKRRIHRISVPIDKYTVWMSILKLVTLHSLPLQAVEWEGFKMIFDPICHALGITVNRKNTIEYVGKTAATLKQKLRDEMVGKLVSVQIDSASRHGRHVLGINVNFYDGKEVVIRVLGMIEVKQRQTAKFLKEKILELLQSYGVSIKQLLAVTCDNGANMVAAVKQLQKQYVVEHPSLEPYDDATEDDEDEAGERLIEDLMEELQKSVSLVRCAVHTMQLAVTDVVKATDANIKEITAIAKSTRKIAYKAMFDYNKVSVPPLYSRTRWNGVYKMLNYFKQHEELYKDIGRQYPELDLTNHWDYIDEYVAAFEPVFACTNKMQAKHVSLSDFYVHWLNTVMQVGMLEDNSLAKTLVTSLTQRLIPLKSNMAFKASLLIDPRFNYLNAKTLSAEEKDQTRSYMLATWDRIKQLDPETCNEAQGNAQQPRQTNQFDTFLTNLFGGLPPTKNQETKSLHQQLNALDLEAHQSFAFDVFQYWKNREKTHPELSKLAMVFQSVPSNQINVERCFSGMALTLTERRTNISDEGLENILLIKLNSDLINEIVPENSFD